MKQIHLMLVLIAPLPSCVGGVDQDTALSDAEILRAACGQDVLDACLLLDDVEQAEQEAQARRALASAEAHCSDGNARSCVEAGRIHYRGRVVDRNEARAAGLFRRACELGDGLGCSLTRRADPGAEVVAVPDFAHLEAECSSGSADSCFHQAAALLAGRGVEQDRAQARRLMDSACGLGQPHACLRLQAIRIKDGDLEGASEAWEQAVEIVERMCEDGDGELCELGGQLFSTTGQDGDDGSRAVGLFEQACELGVAGACLSAANAYHYGGFAGFESDNNLAIPVDEARALALHDAACQLWYGHGCAPAYLEPEELERGPGEEAQALPEDAPQAMISAANQCDQGELTGCTRLGLLYLSETRQRRNGAPTDEAARELQNAGLRLLRTSCTEGSLISACPALAKHCASNLNVCTEDVEVYRQQARQNYPVDIPRFSVEPAPPVVLVATAALGNQTEGLPIRLAVWSNGHVVWSEDRQVGGPPLREGWLDPESVDSVLDNLDRVGLFEDWDFVMGGSIPGDGPLTVVVIDDGSRRFEVVSDYEWAASHKTDRFATRWDEMRELLEELVPDNGTPFDFDTLNRLRQAL